MPNPPIRPAVQPTTTPPTEIITPTNPINSNPVKPNPPRPTLETIIITHLTTLAATLTLTGCTGMIPLSTPPGTYTLNITAPGSTTGLTHTLPITLTVTSE